MVDDPLKTLGEKLKKARVQQGFSHQDLADRAKIAVKYLENIEKGNREDLPEEAYLMSFINKIAKTLGISDPSKLINEYKEQEGNYIVQKIVNDNFDHAQSSTNASFVKIYHLYIIIALLFAAACYYLFSTNKLNEVPKEIVTLSQIENTNVKPEQAVVTVEEVVEEVQEEIPEQEEALDKEQREEIAKLDPELNIYGEGGKTLSLAIKEVTWFQVYGIAAGKVLYEGDAFPNVKPNEFEFHDDIGFALASGNAGAFRVYDSGKTYSIGKSGELIKWYYPEGARYEYKQRNHR